MFGEDGSEGRREVQQKKRLAKVRTPGFHAVAASPDPAIYTVPTDSQASADSSDIYMDNVKGEGMGVYVLEGSGCGRNKKQLQRLAKRPTTCTHTPQTSPDTEINKILTVSLAPKHSSDNHEGYTGGDEEMMGWEWSGKKERLGKM